jgi:HEAT repeat protein
LEIVIMWKRRILVITVLIVGLLVVVWKFPSIVYVGVGMAKGEATFDGKPTDYWVRALKQEGFLGEAPPPGDAGKTLREGGAKAVPVLCEIVRGPDERLRTDALGALCLMGPEAKDAVPLLSEIVKTEKNSGQFLLASQAWGNVDPSAAAEAMAGVLREDGNDLSRKACAFTTLLKMAPQGQEAVPTLKEIFLDSKADPVMRVQAAHVLWLMKQPGEPLVPILCEMISAEKSPVGVQGLHVLGALGPTGKSALPALLKIWERPKLPLTGSSWGAVHRQALVRTLGHMGPDAGLAIPLLINSLLTTNFMYRVEIAQALNRIGPEAKKALAARDAGWATAITLTGAWYPMNLTIPPLAEIEKRTWVPREGLTEKEVRLGIRRVDPKANIRAGIADYPEEDKD